MVGDSLRAEDPVRGLVALVGLCMVPEAEELVSVADQLLVLSLDSVFLASARRPGPSFLLLA